MYKPCEYCKNDYETEHSDAHNPEKYCTAECEQEKVERDTVLNDDIRQSQDFDHSMDA